ncbi:DNA-3-methyladenine glycosylase family protein [Rossellomorea sp. NPDC077527]|uniref:DNA-3-methyladenine glycosylase family protein n=1 Tax=Rossellomorea sp. NPDC077527 TaxID=3364510 RepID=UPI0037C60C2C
MLRIQAVAVKKEGTLFPEPPYDFDKTLAFISKFPPSKEESVNHSYTKAILVHDQVILFHLLSTGNIESPTLQFRLYSDTFVTKRVEEKAINRISMFLSLYDDMKPFYRLSESDPHFYPIVKKLYGYHHVKFLTPFENACWAILSQRTPVPLARNIKHQLANAFGKSIQRNDCTYTAFPEPNHLLNSAENEVLKIVLSKRKTQYILSAAREFAKVSDEFLKNEDYETVHNWLKKINGIGDWSASFIMLRGIGRMEKLPMSEKMLENKILSLYGKAADVSEISGLYGNQVGYWAHYIRAEGLFNT